MGVEQRMMLGIWAVRMAARLVFFAADATVFQAVWWRLRAAWMVRALGWLPQPHGGNGRICG